jgi:hypothetical protein
MSPPRDPARRAFLQALLRAAAFAAAPPLVTALGGCARRDGLQAGLASFFASRASARTVGQEVLSALAQPPAGEPPDGAALVGRLVRGRRREWDALAQAGPEALAGRLRAQHRDDFERDRLLSVRGWLLSETEALLCALAALSEAPAVP